MTVRAGAQPNTWTPVDYGEIVRPVAALWRRIAPYVAGALVVTLAVMFAMSCKGSSVAFRSDSSVTTLNVQVASTPAQRAKGLSGRTSLPEDSGMLFDFGRETQTAFWMKDTSIPLSVAFIDVSGRVIEVANMKPFDTAAVSAHARFRYAVEANQGWFSAHGIKAGSKAIVDL